jgi:hypothetical protein
VRQFPKLILLACCLSVAWLVLIALPIALYQYFSISTPQAIGSLHSAAWIAYLAPLELIRWTPTFSSLDPLVTLIPSFGLLFVLWSVVLLLVMLGWQRWRRAANKSLKRTREG